MVRTFLFISARPVKKSLSWKTRLCVQNGPVTDPGLPREGTNPKDGSQNYYFGYLFPKTAWNFKKLDREAPLGSTNETSVILFSVLHLDWSIYVLYMYPTNGALLQRTEIWFDRQKIHDPISYLTVCWVSELLKEGKGNISLCFLVGVFIKRTVQKRSKIWLRLFTWVTFILAVSRVFAHC